MDLLGDDGLLDLRRRARRTDPEGVVEEIRDRQEAIPDSNDALRAWRQEDTDAPGGCHLCGRSPRLQCKACGRPACGADSWFMLGLCRDCATEERVQAWHGRDEGANWLEEP